MLFNKKSVSPLRSVAGLGPVFLLLVFLLGATEINIGVNTMTTMGSINFNVTRHR